MTTLTSGALRPSKTISEHGWPHLAMEGTSRWYSNWPAPGTFAFLPSAQEGMTLPGCHSCCHCARCLQGPLSLRHAHLFALGNSKWYCRAAKPCYIVRFIDQKSSDFCSGLPTKVERDTWLLLNPGSVNHIVKIDWTWLAYFCPLFLRKTISDSALACLAINQVTPSGVFLINCRTLV